MNNSKILPQIGLVLTTLAWGATFVLVKESLNDANPFIFAFYRFLLAAFAIVQFAFLKDKKIFSNFNSHEIKGGILCGFLLYMGYSFQNYGLEITTPSKSAFITSMSILLVPIFVFFIKKKKINHHLWISIIIATVGLYLLLDPGYLPENQYSSESSSANIGDFLTFGCAVFFAIHIIIRIIDIRIIDILIDILIVRIFHILYKLAIINGYRCIVIK